MIVHNPPLATCSRLFSSSNPVRMALAFMTALWLAAVGVSAAPVAEIPLPEHPRPDFQRPQWENLNGTWAFKFDKENVGMNEGWSTNAAAFPDKIMVPFPWGSKLSGLEDKADIGWYARTIKVPEAWRGQRVFLVVGASDWLTKGYLDGHCVGINQGGYTPFEFELTARVQFGKDQSLVLRVDDTPHPFKLEGKQGYGQARGLWQTAYLEARPKVFVQTMHFTPDIDAGKVNVLATLSDAAPENAQFVLKFTTGDQPEATQPVKAGATEVQFDLPIKNQHLWSLDDPFLYEVEAKLTAGTDTADQVSSYFGMRKISVVKFPSTGYPYIALNNKPVYLQITLDQSYHPEGFYTFPSDAFMRDEILRSKQIGLNANRIHIKVEVPRKLYWADKLGLLIMADVPNFWGQPDADARAESETALRGMIQRDYNHPAIFSWITFNETWGLFDKNHKYLPETQDWVASMYRLAKSLDASRLVEDNSACNNDHVVTDINSWHSYLPGYKWHDHLAQVVKDTVPGSKWNFIGGRTQGEQPLLNSECGNVWGYDGSTGDVDWSWDYHIMMNEFRRQPKICGWLYTEHHDVINEWNGYYRFDRSEKFTGLETLNPGMSLNDLHAPFYIAPGGDLCQDVKPGDQVKVPIWASFMTDRAPAGQLVLRVQCYGWDNLGNREWFGQSSQAIDFEPWMIRELTPLEVNMPDKRALVIMDLTLEDGAGGVLHRNFTTFNVTDGPEPRTETVEMNGKHATVVRFAPDTFKSAKWSLKQWNVLDGAKVNGAGSGYFEYRLPWPEGLDLAKISGAAFRAEVSAKPLLGKDKEKDAKKDDGDYMRGKGLLDPSQNPNSYPMTDTARHPSIVHIRVNGVSAGAFNLADDPADHQGILSWHAQKRDGKLREAGTYGYLIQATIPEEALKASEQNKEIVLRLEVDSALPGGVAIYGENFGRYPMDPTLVFQLKD
jgi:hypothetical protein